MPFTKGFKEELAPVYLDLDGTKGVYKVEPGEDPFIALDITLSAATAKTVYRALVDFHDNLPDVYRLFPLLMCYEDLPLPQTAPAPVPAAAEIIFLGYYQAKRYFTYSVYNKDEIRLIGS